MRWIVQGSKESAEAAGANPEGDEVMFVITPNYIAEVYNRYRNDVDEDEPDFEDRWGMLSDEQRGKILDEDRWPKCSRRSRGEKSWTGLKGTSTNASATSSMISPTKLIE